MISLEGKIALVTGASRGIGQAIALAMARNGAFVYGTATTEQGAHLIDSFFEKEQLAGKGMILDVTQVEQVENLMAFFSDKEYPSILVNNAGITEDDLLLRMDDEKWNKVIDTNLSAVYRMSKAFLKPMFRARTGRIISVGSVVGSSGNAGQVNYAAAKAGLIGFSKSLAQEIGSRGITVNVVAPGFIKTEMTQVLPDKVKEEMEKKIPLRKLGEVEDVAEVVVFLSSDSAKYITGETIHVNGGIYMS